MMVQDGPAISLAGWYHFSPLGCSKLFWVLVAFISWSLELTCSSYSSGPGCLQAPDAPWIIILEPLIIICLVTYRIDCWIGVHHSPKQPTSLKRITNLLPLENLLLQVKPELKCAKRYFWFSQCDCKRIDGKKVTLDIFIAQYCTSCYKRMVCTLYSSRCQKLSKC